MAVQRLGKENYDEIIQLMNQVFGHRNGRDTDFERELPKMCVRDDEHMRKHFGVFEDGKLVACLGVYPYETVVAGQKMIFATTGNIVTHWDYEGRGYMGQMLDCAMQELEDCKVDVARLGGLRSRYNRYGFESCGQKYEIRFTTKNMERKFADVNTDLTFEEIKSDDVKNLQFAVDLYNQGAIAVTRNVKEAYATMSAWRNVPYVAIKDGKKVGYLCTKESGRLAECFGVDTQSYVEIVCSWLKYSQREEIYFVLQPHMTELVGLFTMACESSYIATPSHFYIRHWDKVVDAFMKLKASYCEMTQGELIVEIEEYGRIRLYVNENGAGCEKSEKEPDVTLDRLSASRYIFGPYSPIVTGKANALAQAWLPLPLSWNGQDRV